MRIYNFFCGWIVLLAILIISTIALGDDTFNKLFAEKKYKEALEYADEKLPVAERDAMTWIKMGEANNAIGMPEKALACFLVSWRMNPNDYNALLGAARAYNKLEQYDNALNMSKKAFEIKPTAEAAWEYAQASISLGRPAEAKAALEKVLENDSTNVIAIRELSNIYFREGAWSSAIPVLKKGYMKSKSGETAYQIGKAYTELGVIDSAIQYLKKALETKTFVNESRLLLARVNYKKKNFAECIEMYKNVPTDTLTADDYFKYGNAIESIHGFDASVKFYEIANEKFGYSTVPEALLTKEKLAKVKLKAKSYRDALELMKTVTSIDKEGKIATESYFLMAEAYEGINDISNAIASLEKAISINSRNIEAYARLADLYQKSGNSEKAKKVFDVMMGLSPNDPNIYLSLGNYNLKSGKYNDALQNFEKSCELKRTALCKLGIAKASFELKKYELSMGAAEEALKIDAKSTEAQKILALAYFKQGEHEKAAPLFEKVILAEGDNLEILNALAECYEKLKDIEKLSAIDKKIVKIDEKDLKSRIRLAKYYESKNKLTDAIALYKEIILLDPSSVDILKRLYQLSMKLGERGTAIAYLIKYLSIKSNDAEAHRDLGDLYYDQKDYDRALDEYRRALKLDPSIKGFYSKYAEIVMAKGEQDEVIKALRGVIASGNADVGTYMTLGMMYHKKGEYIDAMEMYQKVLEIEPSNFDALIGLGACQAAQGEIKNAIISYEQAIMMKPNAVKELKELGDLYLRAFRKEEAYKSYRKYLAIDSSDSDLAKNVAEYLYESGSYDDAVRYYRISINKLSAEEAIRFVDACYKSKVKNCNNSEIISLLLTFKNSKSVKDKTKSEIYRLLAFAFESDSNFIAASQTYGDYLKLPNVYDPEAAFRMAKIIEKKDPLQARQIYENNIKKYPADYRNYLSLALLYSQSNETLSKALPLFKKVTELADSVPIVWLELGKIYGKLGKDEDELNAYKKYTEFDPQNAEANKKIGTILIRKGQINEAIVFLEIANTTQPNDPEIMSALGKAYIKTNRYDEAINLLVKAKAKKTEDPDIRFQLFETYMKTGKKDLAQKEIEELISFKKEPKYMLLYAEALSLQHKHKEALDVIEEILSSEPENISALMLNAKILRQMKKYDDAIEIYKEINTIQPDYALSLLERAEAHLEQGKPQWAETFYTRALRNDPTLARAELGLAKVAKLRKDMIGYREHLENARRLNPDDEAVIEELKKVEGKDNY